MVVPRSEPRYCSSFADDPPLLQLVDLDHRGEELEVVARVARELLQRRDVLGEARAAEADAGTEEVRAEPVVEPDALRDVLDVGADALADVRDLVDEADARGQEGVGGELDHLGGVDVHPQHRRVDPLVERLDRVAVLRLEGADDDPVGLHEVPDGESPRP